MSSYAYNKRWRLSHPEKRYAGKLRYYQKTMDAPNRCAPWEPFDVDTITAAGRPPDSVLASQIGRSVEAIQHKRQTMQRRGQ